MIRQWLNEPDQTFSPLEGRHPVAILDEHVSGDFIAMQVFADSRERAAIWNTRSRETAWAPDNVNALCWSPNGTEVFVIQYSYQHAANHPVAIATPLQREFSYAFEQRAWPDLTVIAKASLKLPKGWPVHLAPSPARGLACVVWNDQREAGIEFVAVAATGVRQLTGEGYYGEMSNILEGPAYSPDGRFMVLSYGNHAWWAKDQERGMPSPGGLVTVGWVVIANLTMSSFRYQRVEVQTGLPKGWLPKDLDDPNNEAISPARFTDDDCFVIALPTGEVQCFSVSRALRLR